MRRRGNSRSGNRFVLTRLILSFVWLALALGAARIAGAAADPDPPVELELPADLVYEKVVGPDSAVTFRHTTHVALAENRCTGCHPRPFRMLRPTGRTRHAEMNAGQSCGACHDGRQAFGVRDRAACGSCHSGRATAAIDAKSETGPATAAAPKLPKAYRFRSADSPGPVTFRHETHTKKSSSCAPCHPKPFGFKAPKGGIEMHTACGSCHDEKKSFGVEDVEKCARCHKEGGSR